MPRLPLRRGRFDSSRIPAWRTNICSC